MAVQAGRWGAGRRAAAVAALLSAASPAFAEDLPWGEPLADAPAPIGDRDALARLLARAHDAAGRPARVAADGEDRRALAAWLPGLDPAPELADDADPTRCTLRVARGPDLGWALLGADGPCLVRRPERRATLLEVQAGPTLGERGRGGLLALQAAVADAAGWSVGGRLAAGFEGEASGDAIGRETRASLAAHGLLALRDGPVFVEVGLGVAAIGGRMRAPADEPPGLVGYGPRVGGSLTSAVGVRLVGRRAWTDPSRSLALRYTALPARGHVVALTVGVGLWRRAVTGRDRALAPPPR